MFLIFLQYQVMLNFCIVRATPALELALEAVSGVRGLNI
jgi:hypothetical protein